MRLWFFLIVCFVCFFFFYSDASLVWAELLKEQDLQIKKELTSVNINQPIDMNLYYQGIEGNYVIFYDFKRDSLYLQYRIDRWDYDQNHIVQKLKIGLLYQVKFTYLGEVSEVPKSMLYLLEQRKQAENKKKASKKADDKKKPQDQGINSSIKEPNKQNREKNPLNRKKTLSIGRLLSVDYAYLDKLMY